MRIKIFITLVLVAFVQISIPHLIPLAHAENNITFPEKPLDKSSPTIFPRNNQYGWDTVSEWKIDRKQFKHNLQILTIYDDNKQSFTINCLKSVIAPGWGHFSAKNYTKGEILLGLQMFLFGSSLYFYDKSMDSYDNYKNATNINDISQYYTDANASFQTSQLFIGFWALVWGYTIIDSFQATENYNRDLWKHLVMKYKNKKITLTPNGVNIRF